MTDTQETNGAEDMPKLLRPAKVAETLDVAPRTLRKWRRCGAGPAFVKLGSQVRYTEQAVLDYLATCMP